LRSLEKSVRKHFGDSPDPWTIVLVDLCAPDGPVLMLGQGGTTLDQV
jgi:hypothetical protein